MATKKTAKVKKMDGFSADVRQEKLDALKQLIPEAFADGKIDVKRLKKIFGEDVPTEDERYRLEWSGKAEVFDEIAERSSCTLTLDEKRSSKDWKDSNNIFIEGENLEVLRTLQKAYSGKVKTIYIDPPYNTGEDFVYNDDFSESEEEYCEDECNLDENGLLKKAYKLNSRDGGRFHSNWLSMMYPRLYLAKNVLHDEGVIFVSIDHNELHNLRIIMNEVFGEENFINTVSVNMKNVAGASGGGEDKRLKKNIEYLVIYAKNYANFPSFENVFDLVPIDELVETYREEGKSWKYTSVLIEPGKKKYIGSTVDGDGNEIKIYKRDNPLIKSIGQIVKEEKLSEAEAYRKYAGSIFQTAMPQSSIRPRVMKKVQELKSKGELFSIEYVPKTGRNKGLVYEQFYKGDSFRLFAWLRDVSVEIDGRLYKKEMQGTYWDFASETKNLTKEGGVPFPNGKKPVAMLTRILEMQADKDSLVLDFFAGSGSMAHAVVKQNAEDGGNRSYICVQMPEEIPKEDDLYELGYKKVSDVALARINNAMKKISPKDKKHKIDIGLRVYKESESHFPQWHSQVFKSDKDLEQAMIEYSKVEPVGTVFDRATEVLLKLGYPLTTGVVEKDGYMLAQDEVALVLDSKFVVKNLQKVIDASPKTIIVLEKLFKKDEEKINFALRCKEANVIFQTV